MAFSKFFNTWPYGFVKIDTWLSVLGEGQILFADFSAERASHLVWKLFLDHKYLVFGDFYFF